MSYSKTNWSNYSGQALNADNLNKIENELEYLDYNTGYNIDAGNLNNALWLKLATITFSAQGQSAIINCVSGDGANGLARQNSVFEIVLKQGWTQENYPIGFTVNFLQNYNSNYKFKLKHLAKNSAEIYIYLPFTYNDLTYSITGAYTSFVRHNERLDS